MLVTYWLATTYTFPPISVILGQSQRCVNPNQQWRLDVPARLCILGCCERRRPKPEWARGPCSWRFREATSWLTLSTAPCTPSYRSHRGSGCRSSSHTTPIPSIQIKIQGGPKYLTVLKLKQQRIIYKLWVL